VGLAFDAENILNGVASNGTLRGHGGTAELRRWLGIRRADFFYFVPNSADGGGQFPDVSTAADVHEINLRLIIKEMIVQRRDRKAVVQRDTHDGIHFVLKQ